MSHSAEHHDHAHDHHDEHFAHAMPKRMLLSVFAALIFLTVVTVLAANIPLGQFEIWVSMGIATVKALLVAFFFMHLLYDKSFNAMVFLFSLIFVALFLGFTLMDSGEYQPTIQSLAPATPPADQPH